MDYLNSDENERDAGNMGDDCINLKGTITGAAITVSSSHIDSDTTKLWRMRLEHMSEKGMDMLSKQGLLGSKKIGKLDFCEHCVLGKQCRVKFSQAINTTKGTVKKEEPFFERVY
ncbi:hypothetical protein RJ639_031577 [Escallonia herrerae]|uniref:GAG-pre-integrase domain-containing protein n=1 Tax=Escallonia herrerae TaxID=1293975 RepID=A0AA88X9H5_9ASTE|nr:hypothetical protein RJ639_031577 [Escallonia herrerae]